MSFYLYKGYTFKVFVTKGSTTLLKTGVVVAQESRLPK